MSIFRQSLPPAYGVLTDKWVDTSDQDKIYVCTTAYDSTAVERVFAFIGFGGAPILIKTVSPHAYAKIAILDGGASGVASASRTGSGTAESPYVYTLTLYDNSSSNNTIIAILGALPGITAEGANADHGLVTPLIATDMDDNIKEEYWTVRSIYARFVAEPPEIFMSDEKFPGYIPPIIRNVLPEIIAIRLAGSDGAGDLARTQKWEQTVFRAKRSARNSGNAETNTRATKRYFA